MSRNEERLAHFKEVTGVADDGLATQMLVAHNWDVNAAVHEFLAGGVELPSPQHQPVPPANTGRAFEQPLHRRSVSPPSRGTGPPPRTPLRSESDEGNDEAPLLGSGQPRSTVPPDTPSRQSTSMMLISFPFKIISLVLRTVLFPVRYLLGSGEAIPPQVAAQRFIDVFEEEYGNVHPTFQVKSFQQSVQQASRESKFLMVYLHSPLHEDTSKFCRQTLTADALVSFVNENLLMWAGSVQFPDAYATSGLLETSAYPFLALLVCQPRNVEVVDRIEGALDCEQVMQRVSAAMARHQDLLDRQLAVQREREERARLQEEQNREYQEALEADRRREAARKAEEEKKAREEEEARQRQEREEALMKAKKQEKEAILQKKRDSLPPEPVAPQPAMKLRLQFPNGTKSDRRFSPTDSLQVVRDYIDIFVADNKITLENYSMSATFPKRTFEDLTLNLQAAGLHSADTIYITDLDA